MIHPAKYIKDVFHFRNFQNIFLFISFILIAYLVVFFGSHPTDHDFINSLSYRVSLGQIPYKDFEWVKTPLTLYLHSIGFIIFPDFAILFSRIVFLIQMTITSYFTVKILVAIKIIRDKNDIWYTLIFLLLSLHNFPATPWPTIDGLFFSVLSLYFIVSDALRNKTYKLILCGIFCICAGLAKQNFFLLIPIFLIISSLVSGIRSLYVLLGIILGALIFLFLLLQADLLAIFLASRSDDSNIFEILISLVHSFQLTNNRSLLPSVVIFSIFTLLSNLNFITKRNAVIASITGLFLLIILELYFFNWGKYVNPSSLYQIAFVTSIYIFLSSQKNLTKLTNFDNLIMVSLFGIGFSAMISWGYPYPNLFNAPFFALILGAFEKYFGYVNVKKLFLSVFAFWLLISNIMYMDEYKISAKNNLGDIYPKLNHIYVGDTNYRSYKNLKEISSGYDVESVIPGFPIYSYINNVEPSFRIDWFLDPEAIRKPEEYLKNMEGKIFIVMNECYENERHPKRITVCKMIHDNSQILKSSEDLKLYKFNGLNLLD